MATGTESNRASAKDWIDIVQGILTVIAIAAGGWWFLQQGLAKPRIRIDQTVTYRPMAGSPDLWLIAVDVRATNIGSVGVHLDKGWLVVGQVNPLPGRDLLKADLKELWLQPGEGDQALFHTYQVPATVKTLQLISNYQVPGKKLYWTLISVADLQADDSAGKESAASPTKTGAKP